MDIERETNKFLACIVDGDLKRNVGDVIRMLTILYRLELASYDDIHYTILNAIEVTCTIDNMLEPL